MSKRFGRNQRRRAREALAEAKAQIDSAHQRISDVQDAMSLDRALLARQRAELNEADHYARDVLRIVGRYSIITGEPSINDLQWDIKKNGLEINTIPQVAIPRLSDFRNESAQMSLSRVRHETMMLLDIDAVADEMRACMHMQVTLSNKTTAYAINDKALRLLNENELVTKIVPDIAKHLVRQLKGNLRGHT